ncbi:MAG: hypothetical protein HKN26_12645 [Acidimicrobiales bacterium]|nr:hypothetical protein [Acidimicrobiales bacterium]
MNDLGNDTFASRARPGRAALIGAGIAVAAAAIIGITTTLGGNSSTEVETAAPETTAGPSTTSAPTSIPTTTESIVTAPPSTISAPGGAPPIILIDGSSSVQIDGVRYASGLADPVRDAFDDTVGGLVFQTDHGIFHRPAGSSSPRFVTTGQLLDVAPVTGAVELLLTRVADNDDGIPEQRPYRHVLTTGAEIALPISGGVEWGVHEGGFSGPDSAMVLSGGDGFCRGMSRTALDGTALDGVPYTQTTPSCTLDAATPTDELLHVGEGRPDGTVVWISTESRRAAGQNTVHFANPIDGSAEALPGAASGVPFHIDTSDGFVLATTRAEVWVLDVETGEVTTVARGSFEAVRFARSAIDLPTGLQIQTNATVPVTAVNNLTVVTSPGDPLNVRAGPGIGYPVLTQLPHLTGQVSNLPTAVRLPNGDLWYEIVTALGDQGWVNGRDLQQLSLVGTATCRPTLGFPVDGSTLDQHLADLDRDGLDDVLSIVVSAESDRLWARVEFGNGGVADGEWTDFWEIAPGGNTVGSIDLDHVPNGLQEIVLQHSSGASGSNYGVMHLSGCSWTPSTFAGDVFTMTSSASAIATDWGCAYGTGGRLDFTTRTIDFNADTWSLTTWHFDAGTWTEVDVANSADFPAVDPPPVGPCDWN